MKTLDDRTNIPESAEGSGRRRFVRGVGAGIPLVLTASARSSLAATCSTVSANASINLTHSHNATADVGTCLAQSPDIWAAQSSSYTGKAVKFGSVFSTTDPVLNAPSFKMSDAVSSTSTLRVRHFAAAYLNLVNGKVQMASGGDYYSLLQLQYMWNQAYDSLPGGSAYWDDARVDAYLVASWS